MFQTTNQFHCRGSTRTVANFIADWLFAVMEQQASKKTYGENIDPKWCGPKTDRKKSQLGTKR